ETPRLIVPSGRLILVVCGTDDPAGAPVKALKETAEADAYATSLHEAAEIAVNAAHRPALEGVTPFQPANQETSNLVDVVSNREAPLKIVSQPPAHRTRPAKNRKNLTRRGGELDPKLPHADPSGSADRTRKAGTLWAREKRSNPKHPCHTQNQAMLGGRLRSNH